MNCTELLRQFISENGINTSYVDKIEHRINEFNEVNEDKSDMKFDLLIISRVLVDSFKLNSENLKKVTNYCVKKGIQIGRRHKRILLKFLDYRNEIDLELFFKELLVENSNLDINDIRKMIDTIPIIGTTEAIESFLKLWNIAIQENDEKKLLDYLWAIYSKLYAMNNNVSMSNIDLFTYNEEFIGEDLQKDSIIELKSFCEEEILSKETFYQKYISLLRKELQQKSLNGELEFPMNQNQADFKMSTQKRIFDRKGDLHYILTEQYDAIYFRINQQVFNEFENKIEFYNYVLDSIQQIFRIVVNNKAVVIEIDNIYSENINIKWMLYAYIGVYAERFIRTEERRKFYSAEKIAKEMFKVYGIEYDIQKENEVLKKLKLFYNAKKVEIAEKVEAELFDLIISNMNKTEFHKYLEEWKFVYYGFSFNDCFVVRGVEDNHIQYINNVKNDNKLLFVFYKYRMDERKIPCPICNGLNVSGNSYSEIGHKSWECKNVICRGRSKSNRGKRYSFKTNYMQSGIQNLDSKNVISKEMIAKWRKDIAFIKSDKELYEMFLKYFSFPDENILFINGESSIIDEMNELGRNLTNVSCIDSQDLYVTSLPQINICNTLFEDYFERGQYIFRFIRNKNSDITRDDVIKKLEEDADAFVINGDSFEILNCIPAKSVAAIVTSPPYFNAREYSQWENIYLYFIDMYNIVKKAKTTLDDSGIFLYNIGDVNGNEMTIAKSNMGKKRLLLGAYSILIFEKAGYELVENYIWNKGEPQSKRSTNDGNFTPHYQKPVNCYEHMFIFKKKGAKLETNDNLIPKGWNNYVVEFLPVYKFNSKGENTVGHTAPYPEDIPNFVVKVFGKKDKLILDPFLGSGTSIVSAVKNGYIGVGIEFSKEYAELAKNRLEKDIPDIKVELI